MVRTTSTEVSYTLLTERNNTKGNENENFWKFGDIRIWKKIKKKP